MRTVMRGALRALRFGVSVAGAVAVLVLVCIAGGDVYAQLQQSGGPGSTVTVGAALPAGSNIIGKVGIDQTTPGTTNGVQVVAALPAGANAIGKLAGSNGGVVIGDVNVVGTLPALTAGTNTIGVVIPKTPCGTTVANQDLAAVPTSATAVFSSTTCLIQAYFNNTTGSSVTVTLTDNAGTPLNGVGPAFSLPALSNMMLPFAGVRFASGVKWTASGAGVTGAMWGYQ
jgi:hypothetical protein